MTQKQHNILRKITFNSNFSEGAQAWVTLATNDSYAMGALVLAKSLRRVNTTKQLAVMISPGVSGAMK